MLKKVFSSELNQKHNTASPPNEVSDGKLPLNFICCSELNLSNRRMEKRKDSLPVSYPALPIFKTNSSFLADESSGDKFWQQMLHP